MDSCETGSALSPNYFTKRYEYIRTQFPSLNEDDLNEWAHCTRGLTFGDINNVIQSDLKPVPCDPWNTCDRKTEIGPKGFSPYRNTGITSNPTPMM